MGIEPMLLPWKGSVLTTWPTVHVQEYPISVRYPLFKHLLPNTTSDKYRRADLNCHLRSEKRYAIFNNDQSRNRTYEWQNPSAILPLNYLVSSFSLITILEVSIPLDSNSANKSSNSNSYIISTPNQDITSLPYMEINSKLHGELLFSKWRKKIIYFINSISLQQHIFCENMYPI